MCDDYALEFQLEESYLPCMQQVVSIVPCWTMLPKTGLSIISYPYSLLHKNQEYIYKARSGKLNGSGVAQSERACDVLDCCFLLRQKKLGPGASTQAITEDLWANPSQSVSRKPWSVGKPATTTTSSELYSFEHNAVLSGNATLTAMGHPSNSAPRGKFSERSLRCFAGESFSVPIVAMITHAIYVNPHAPWWGKP